MRGELGVSGDGEGDARFFLHHPPEEPVGVEVPDVLDAGVLAVKCLAEGKRVIGLHHPVADNGAVDWLRAGAAKLVLDSPCFPETRAPAVKGRVGGSDGVKLDFRYCLLEAGVRLVVEEEGNPEVAPVRAHHVPWLEQFGGEGEEEGIGFVH